MSDFKGSARLASVFKANTKEKMGVSGKLFAAPTSLTDNHALLRNRDAQDQHPIEAITNLRPELDNRFDDAYVEKGYLILCKGEDTYKLGPFAGGGGGSGGGGNNAVLTFSNTTGWVYKTLAQNSDCILKATWSSLEDSMPTGSGILTVKVGGVVKYMENVGQGQVSVNVAEYLSAGSNTVKMSISDVYENTRTITFTIQIVALVLTSTFDSLAVYNSAIPFVYTPIGAVSKTVHILLDGQEIGSETITESGRQQTYIIPAQPHGSHSLMAYFEAEVDGDMVSSNVLYYDIICVEEGHTEPIIASTFRNNTAEQYIGFTIPYLVYDPVHIVTAVDLYANGELLRTISVDRTVQQWAYQPQTIGELALEIRCGDTVKRFELDVSASSMDVEATTRDLSLYLTAYGRSNGEANPATWGYNGIAAELSGFQFVSDGWVNDADGNDILRVQGDARVSIPARIFKNDFRTTGKTIEIEFETSKVMDYDTPIISCWSGGRGILITPQKVVFASEQVSLEVSYKEEEHVRVTFVIEKRTESRLVYLYLNGIMSGVVQYDTNDDFTQLEPVGISIGSNLCTTDIYCLRVYENNLTRIQVLNNWIADTQNGTEKLARYERNNIYDAYGVVDIDKLPSYLPVMIWEIPILPTYKGDKRNATSITFDDQVKPEQSFIAGVSQMNVQGTSSQYYYRKNFKIKFSNGLTVNGTVMPKYALRPGAIPEKEFTLKADVASSEGANNVELVRLYNDASKAYGIKTPPQLENGDLRVGIDGFPMVCFHNNGSETYFYGKFNFNNDKANESTFGFSEGDESWEVRNNTSNRVLFKSADFEGDDWQNDFEARYPDTDPAYVDTSRLAAMCAWVVSTDRDAVDTEEEKAARLAKFRDELEDWFDLDSSMFYYLFTELFLMVDSRAKNAFPTYWHETGKWFWLPYDMDTALGINNEGALVFGYHLEDTDELDGALVFNGQTSTFWCNLRDAFPAEIQAMYAKLRGQAFLNYNYVEGQFEEHQSKWSEAIFNEDSYSKYLEPLIKNNDNTYLEMLQGSKAQQRKWWLYNRFRYIDSKYNAGDALSDYIQLRGYSLDSITVEPYADIYASIKYGSYLVQTRALRGQAYTLEDPLDAVNDTEIYIYSASQLKSVGDLSGLKVGLCDLSRAVKLQGIKLGDGAESYSNPNLRALTFGNNELLKTIDCRNCINLGTGVTAAPDISGCIGVEEVYFEGTKITGIALPNGGVLRTLHLPDTIASLILQNLTRLTDLDLAGIRNITTLRVENTPAADDIAPQIVNQMPANSRIRLTGIHWELETDDILRKLLTMRGLDEYGNNTPTAVVTGRVNVPSISSALLMEINEAFPELVVVANDKPLYLISFLDYDNSVLYRQVVAEGDDVVNPVTAGYITAPTRTGTEDSGYAFRDFGTLPTNVHSNCTVYAVYDTTYRVQFMNDSTVYDTQWIVSGESATTPTPNPTKASTAQYTYTFINWDKSYTNVTEPLTVNAVYTATVRTYTVRFYNGSTLLQTVTNVPYGGSATYTGDTPVDETNGYAFEGWNPSPTNITGDTSCYAQFANPYQYAEIDDTWAQIFAAIDDGSYKTKYHIGNYKPLDLGFAGIINMQIVAMDADVKADGTGKAPITWIGEQLLARDHRMNPELAGDSGNRTEGTGAIGGWEKSEMRSWLKSTIKPLIPSEVRSRIVEVSKTTQICNSDETTTKNAITTDDVWIPSYREIMGGTGRESEGSYYSGVFNNKERRKKMMIHNSSTTKWFLRSTQGTRSFWAIANDGGHSTAFALSEFSVALGFCT